METAWRELPFECQECGIGFDMDDDDPRLDDMFGIGGLTADEVNERGVLCADCAEAREDESCPAGTGVE